MLDQAEGTEWLTSWGHSEHPLPGYRRIRRPGSSLPPESAIKVREVHGPEMMCHTRQLSAREVPRADFCQKSSAFILAQLHPAGQVTSPLAQETEEPQGPGQCMGRGRLRKELGGARRPATQRGRRRRTRSQSHIPLPASPWKPEERGAGTDGSTG